MIHWPFHLNSALSEDLVKIKSGHRKFIHISYPYQSYGMPLFFCTCLNQTFTDMITIEKSDMIRSELYLGQAWSYLHQTWSRHDLTWLYLIVPGPDMLYLTLHDHTWIRHDHDWNYVIISWADMIIPDFTWSYLNQTWSCLKLHNQTWTRHDLIWLYMILPGSDQTWSCVKLHDQTWSRHDHTCLYMIMPGPDMIMPEITWSYFEQIRS